MPGDPGAAVTNGDNAAGGGKPTRTNRQVTRPTTAQPESVITTAEIPRVSAAASPQFPRTADGWHPDIVRRLPAPWGLELAVWLLFVLAVVGLIGLAVEHFHPSWVAFLRNTTSSSHQRASSTTPSTTPTSGSSSTTLPSAALGKLLLVSATKTSATFSVPTSTGFSLAIETRNPCWTVVKSPPTSTHYLFAATIMPKQSPEVIALKGQTSVELSAQASALVIKVGSTRIGAITSPQPGITYTFTPTRR